MKTIWKTTGGIAGAVLILTILTAVNAAVDAQGKPGPQEAARIMAEAAQPGPEHAKLQPLVGRWTYTCKLWMDPSQPPTEMTGTIERKWILGGRFIEERVAGTGLDGKPGFEAFGLIGYDNTRKKYTMAWACTMGTNIGSSVGTCDEAGVFTFHTTCYCPVEQKQIPMIDRLRIETNDRVVMESFRADGGEKTKVMRIVAVREK